MDTLPDGTIAALLILIAAQSVAIGVLAFLLTRARAVARRAPADSEAVAGSEGFGPPRSNEPFATGEAIRTNERIRADDGAFFGVEENLNGDAIYGGEENYDKDDYIGRVSRGAELELLDTAVMKNEFDLDIVQVRVLSNEWDSEVGRIGWVGLDDTSFRSRFNPEARRIE